MSVGDWLHLGGLVISGAVLLYSILHVWVSLRTKVAELSATVADIKADVTNHLATKIDNLVEAVQDLREEVVKLTTWRESMVDRIERIERRENGIGP